MQARGRVDEARLDAMSRSLAHRGPDGQGRHRADGAALGLAHRRLAVIDLAAGAQPFYSEDRRVVAVVNGEIYNHHELRQELQARGHRFRSHCDAEVVPHLYEEQGIEAVARLRGMFALAIWDERAGHLLLARDRLGQKPLVYGRRGELFGFASELNALVAGLGPLTLDLAGLDAYLSLGYIPAPLTIFHEARKLPPGHLALLRRDRPEPTLLRYWRPSFGPKLRLSWGQAREALAEALEESVRMRLMADVPVGLFLSGGVDSSLVASLMTREAPGRVPSFTAGFEEQDFDESVHARTVADRLGLEHHDFNVPESALESLDRVVLAFGEPFADSSALATWWLAGEARKRVKVVLTGDGGDELFAGYPRYHYQRRLRLLDGLAPRPLLAGLARLPLPRRLRRGCELLAAPPERRPLELLAVFGPARKKLLTRGLVTADQGEETLRLLYMSESLGRLDRLLYTDLLSYLPDDLLVKMDIATMAHGLEARSPLLDHHFVSLATRLPESFKPTGRRAKALLKELVAGELPPGFLERPKQGFGLPIRHWLRRGLGDRVRAVLAEPTLAELGLLDLAYGEQLIREHEAGQANHEHRLWALWVLGRWLCTHQGYRLPRGVGAVAA